MPKRTEQIPPELWPDANQVRELARYLNQAYGVYVSRYGTNYLAGMMACLNLAKHVVLDIGEQTGESGIWRNLAVATFIRMMEREGYDTQDVWVQEILEIIQGTKENETK